MPESIAWDQPSLADQPGRICVACREWKRADAFYRSSKSSDGMASRCRACHRAYNTRRVERKCERCNTAFEGSPRARFCPGLCRRPTTLDPNATEKTCSTCRETKSLDEFHPRRRNGSRLRPTCKACDADAQTARVTWRARQARGLPAEATLPPWNEYPEGSRRINTQGYVFVKIKGHHRADRYGWVREHILVAEEKYGFPITREFTVDHLNDQRDDNRPENLRLKVGNHGVHGHLMPTLLARDEERGISIGVLLDHPLYRAELFAEIGRRSIQVPTERRLAA